MDNFQKQLLFYRDVIESYIECNKALPRGN